MKKSLVISAHLTLWVFFALMVLTQSHLFLEAKPDVPFGDHFTYVVFLEVVMGMIFFYTTFFAFMWAKKSTINSFILAVILILLLVVFAIPALRIGFWQVMSSVVPHLSLIFLAMMFRSMAVTESN
jgi:hypothetical protein